MKTASIFEQSLDAPALAGLRLAAAELVGVIGEWAERGGMLRQLTAGESVARQWVHYPEGVAPRDDDAFFFYHCHPAARGGNRDEHGHFHFFLRQVSEGAPAASDAPHVHLAAIAMDCRGLPVRAFTTNRWVTGGGWECGESLLRRIGAFARIGGESPSPIDRWAHSLVALFAPQIAALIASRDRRLQQLCRGRPAEAVFEDRRIETLSQCPLDLVGQIEAVEKALAA